MEFQDKVLKCIDCGNDFIFTAGEQLFFHDKQFKNEPKRCKACKTKRGSVLGAPPAAGRSPAVLLDMTPFLQARQKKARLRADRRRGRRRCLG